MNAAFRHELADELAPALEVHLRDRLRRFTALSRSGRRRGCVAAAFLSAPEFTAAERRAFDAVRWGRDERAAALAGVDVSMVREMRGTMDVYFLNWNRTTLEVVGPMLDVDA